MYKVHKYMFRVHKFLKTNIPGETIARTKKYGSWKAHDRCKAGDDQIMTYLKSEAK